MLGVFGGILAQKVLKPWSPAAQPQLQLVQDLTNSRLFYLVQTDSKNCFIAGVQQIYIVHQMFASCLNFTWRSWSHKLCLFFTKFSPGFWMFTEFLDFTRFSPGFWMFTEFLNFTKFSPCFWIFTELPNFTKFSPSF